MSTDNKTKEYLDTAVEAFYDAWAAGNWQKFFDLFADEFIFEFPTGPIVGRWEGAGAVEKRDQWREIYETTSRLDDPGEDLRLYDGRWVVVCDHGVGNILGRPYLGVETVMMRVDDEGKIVEYREFLGNLGQPKQ